MRRKHRRALDDYRRLKWLEKHQGYALISDDMGHWACVVAGFQNIPDPAPGDVQATFFIGKDEWHTTIQSALDAAMCEKDPEADHE